MKKNIFKCIVIIGLFVLSTKVSAQQAISTSGESFSNENGFVSFTIGQVVFESIDNSGQGVQQPPREVVLSTTELELEIVAFPNPMADILCLNITDGDFAGYTYQLAGIDGKKIIEGKLSGLTSEIHVGNLSTSLYLLNITKEGKLIKSIKLIKN
ncbi:T9SS type A sorting domain-containing protein [Flavobacterium sp. JAS]|uniref:T9SS type A sorting domain-containing protein n=1 Tax=Flavobacterium sp. JAS TaxID=2897329 RepID=UPI001E627A8B|nr:T9SS type A sorting domain-containing protein [Flavobacterium sp. JAS]MCD0472368.1 T9SS type A sorting domain-containing protein [Flavobacterium sp. JAS]